MILKNFNFYYQTLHLCLGFILEPFLQLKSEAKVSVLLNDIETLYRAGEWTSVRMSCLRDSGLCFVHHCCAADIQNNWFVV